MKSHFFRKFFRKENIVQFGIAVIALLILHNFVVALYDKRSSREYDEFQVNQREVLSRIEQIGTNVNLIDLGFRGFYLVPKENFKEPLEIAKRQHRINIDTLTSLMTTMEYPHLDSIQIVDRWIQEYMQLAGQGVEHVREGNPEAAVALFETDPGYTLWSKYAKVLESMRSHVASLNENYTLKNQRISQYAFVSQLVLAFFGLLTLALVVYRLRRNEQEIGGLFERIKESDSTYIFNDGQKRKGEKNEQVITRMVANLRTASEFIRNVSTGNLEVEWKGMNKENLRHNQETLAGELLTMRDQMNRVKLDEGNRMWVSEGISIFSEIIRRNQENLQEMSDKLLARIVKYLNANQGGLFFLKEDQEERFLEMTSCYAYDKKKFNEHRVPVDSGMLGQAFLEGEVVVLKEIPAEYIHITSGLGEATPDHLILVPLKFNDQIIGVLELASFNAFTKIHLELLEKISEIVASAVVNSQNSEKMKELLENAQQTAEEMRAQEEEMRQNMEELQATQEELARKEAELMNRIRELEGNADNPVVQANAR